MPDRIEVREGAGGTLSEVRKAARAEMARRDRELAGLYEAASAFAAKSGPPPGVAVEPDQSPAELDLVSAPTAMKPMIIRRSRLNPFKFGRWPTLEEALRARIINRRIVCKAQLVLVKLKLLRLDLRSAFLSLQLVLLDTVGLLLAISFKFLPKPHSTTLPPAHPPPQPAPAGSFRVQRGHP